MHLQNQERMKNLMMLLGKQGEDQLEEIGEQTIGDSSISTIQKHRTMSLKNKNSVPERKHLLPRITNSRAGTMAIEEDKSDLTGPNSSCSLEVDNKHG